MFVIRRGSMREQIPTPAQLRLRAYSWRIGFLVLLLGFLIRDLLTFGIQTAGGRTAVLLTSSMILTHVAWFCLPSCRLTDVFKAIALSLAVLSLFRVYQIENGSEERNPSQRPHVQAEDGRHGRSQENHGVEPPTKDAEPPDRK
jgi:hypothetical protein